MNITYHNTVQKMSEEASRIFLEKLRHKPDMLVCAASGNSPKQLYSILAYEFEKKPDLFSKLRILALDEWGGIPTHDPNSCRVFLEKSLVKPLQISPDRFCAFDAAVENPESESARIQKLIDKVGPIDLCILGLGINGHLGFNEPARFLQPECHTAVLSGESLKHSMSTSMTDTPSFGMTIGMKDILNSNDILLLVTGEKKKEVIRELLTRKISPELPASFLWLHSSTRCMIDKKSSPTL